MVSSTLLLVCAAALASMTVMSVAMENDTATTETSSTPQLGDFPSDDPDSGSSTTDIIRNAVVATVIGVGCVATLCLFVFCGILHCYLSKDKVRDLDGMEYEYQDEYETRINFDVLDNLEPAIRAKIDLDFLAHLTNTDPALLEKYKVHTGTEGDTPINSFCSTPILRPLSTSQSSLKGVTPPKRRSSTMKLQSVNSSSTPQSPAIKRVSTFTDIKELLNTSLNTARHTGLTRQSHDLPPYRGSNPNMEEGHKVEDMTQQLLRLLTAVKMAEHNNEQEMSHNK